MPNPYGPKMNSRGVPGGTDLYRTLPLPETTVPIYVENIGSLLVNQDLLKAEGLLPVLFLHDLGAQITDSVDNARKRGAHLGLEVAIVEATLLKRMLSPFDA